MDSVCNFGSIEIFQFRPVFDVESGMKNDLKTFGGAGCSVVELHGTVTCGQWLRDAPVHYYSRMRIRRTLGMFLFGTGGFGIGSQAQSVVSVMFVMSGLARFGRAIIELNT